MVTDTVRVPVKKQQQPAQRNAGRHCTVHMTVTVFHLYAVACHSAGPRLLHTFKLFMSQQVMVFRQYY